uniref:Uncharacterized protein n=1 Tax=Seriola lalandi dorsalis TaxID=1841481 RepID=A0A3B4WTE6_SERLL
MFHCVTIYHYTQVKHCRNVCVSVFCLPKDHCSSECGDCCPNISLCEQCFTMAEMCNCKLPTMRSCLNDTCPSPTCVRWDCACTCQPPECESCNCLCFEIRIK